jgi:hypothetical protein
MPGSITSVFSEWGDFEAALYEEGVRGLLVTGRGQLRARLTRITLHGLRLSAAEEQLARITFVVAPADMLLISFPTNRRSAPICAGTGMRAGEFLTF